LKARELDQLSRNYKSCKGIDAGDERLVRWIKEVKAQHVLFSKPVSFSIPLLSSELTWPVINALRARR
jgi:hypothetical protein